MLLRFSLTLTALTIIQLFELIKSVKRKTIFISGGTGSVGAMAIPIAKAKELEVITNGSAENKDRVLELGASRFMELLKAPKITLL